MASNQKELTEAQKKARGDEYIVQVMNGADPRQFKHTRYKHRHEKELQEHKPEYTRAHSIAKGSWGVSDKCYWSVAGRRRAVAITFVPRGARVTARLREDIMSHRMLAHPHHVNLLEVFLLPNYLAIVKEYIDGVNLLRLVDHQGKLSEGQARWFFQQTVSVLDYLHRKGIAHKEVKLDNAIMSTMRKKSDPPLMKLTGFMIAMHERKRNGPTSGSRVYEYMAPEMWGTSMHEPYNGMAADMWSLGVYLYYMLFAEYPFPRPRRAVQPEEAPDLLCDLEFPEDIKVSDEAKRLLTGLLAYNIEDRLTITDVCKDSWFLQGLSDPAIKMSDSLEDEANHIPAYRARQAPEAVKEVLEQARHTSDPESIWDDTSIVYPPEIDDHQDQMMSPDECEDFSQVMSYPQSGREIMVAE